MLALLLSIALSCAVERADVKYAVGFGPLSSAPGLATVASLAALPVPNGRITGREKGLQPSEGKLYTVVATIPFAKLEADLDWHIVLQDGAATMIAESVDPNCAPDTPTDIQQAIMVVRSNLLRASHGGGPKGLVGLRVQVTGVLFFDVLHGQHGVAPNGVELHPITDVIVLP
jgi:hypothetical protein